MNIKVKLKICKNLLVFALAIVMSLSFTLTTQASSMGEIIPKNTVETNNTVDTDANTLETTQDTSSNDLDQSENIVMLGSSYRETISISSVEELIDLATRVNEGDRLTEILVELTNDIVLDSKEFWIPIGADPLKPFSGTFNGNGFSITGIHVEENTFGGLFGFIQGAIVENLAIINYNAPKSTAGFFYSAVGSTVSFAITKQDNIMVARSFNLFAASPAVGWEGNYTPDVGWYSSAPGTVKIVEIKTPQQLAGIAQIINDSLIADTLVDWVFILSNDLDLEHRTWVPIGTGIEVFEGTFIGGGNTIYNLTIDVASGGNLGLFGFALPKAITDLTLNKAKMITTDPTQTTSTSAAFLIGDTYGAGQDVIINNISLLDCTIDFETTNTDMIIGGVGGWLGHATTLTNIFINNLQIISESPVNYGLGAVAAFLDCGVTENIVVSNSLFDVNEKPVAMLSPDIWGSQGGAYCAIDNVLVFGNTINSYSTTNSDYGGVYAELAYTKFDAQVVINNAFITATKSLNPDAVGIIGVGIEEDGIPVITNILTDSPDEKDFIIGLEANKFFPTTNEEPIRDVANIYWDNIASHEKTVVGKSSPPVNVNGNASYYTQYMTNGIWKPDDSWFPEKYFYPQMLTLKENENPEIRAVSSIASVALSPKNDGENYKIGAKEIVLPSVDSEGRIITWAGYSGAGTKIEDGNTVIYAAEDTTVIPKITATLTSPIGIVHTKEFENVKLMDSTLKEDTSYRITGNPIYEVDDVKIGLKFKEPIEENPDLVGAITLAVFRNGNWVDIDQVPCVSSDSRFVIRNVSAAENYLEISGLELEPGQNYKLTFPENSVREVGVNNTSKAVELEFRTVLHGAPVIDVTEKIMYFSDTDTITIDTLLDNVVVYEEANGTVIFDNGSVSPDNFGELDRSLWDNKNPTRSITNAFKNTSEFPDNQNTVKYIIDNPSVIGSNPPSSRYNIYILAKNNKNYTDSTTIGISVEGKPEWEVKPGEAVHMPKTDNIDAVLSAGKQGAIALITQTDVNGTEYTIPREVVVSYSADQWESVKTTKRGPSSLKIKLTINDSAGNPAREQDVTVYLDDELKYKLTPSPITVFPTTAKKVEEKINFRQNKFIIEDDIEYEHWENDYKVPGQYYVDMSSEKQWVTNCTATNCKYPGNHPSEYVNEIAVINVLPSQITEVENMWGEAGIKLLEQEYSKNVVNLSPTNYIMPVGMADALYNQPYGRLQFSYHDEYRWNLYSTTLDTTEKWSDGYSLKINSVNNAKVSKLVGGKNKGLQFEFTHLGKLFGDVEVEFNMDKAKEVFNDISDDNLGLYMYDPSTDSLVLISEVIVMNDNWASAVVNTVHPTTYVIKQRVDKEPVVSSSGFDSSYMKISRDADGKLVDTSGAMADNYKEITEIEKLTIKSDGSSMYYSMKQSDLIRSITIGFIGVLVLISIIVIILIKKQRKERG